MSTQPQSIEERRSRFKRPTVPVYNPMDRPKHYEIGGRPYHFKPQEVTEIEDHLDYERDDKNRLLLNVPRRIVQDAFTVAATLVSHAALGPLGFIIMEGDQSTWRQQQHEARQLWELREIEVVEARIAGWEAFCASYATAHPGAAPPTQMKDVTRAFAWRRAYLARTAQLERFTCATCGLRTSTEALLRDHFKVDHPALVLGGGGRVQIIPPAVDPAAVPVPVPVGESPAELDAAEAAEVAAEAAAEPADEPTAEPTAVAKQMARISRTQAQARGRLLAQEAEKQGVKLTDEERKGLVVGSADLIEEISGRLTEVREMARKKAESVETAP